MSRRRRITPSHRALAVRVAAIATVAVAIVSIALGIALDQLVSHRLTNQVSQEVTARLLQALRAQSTPPDSPRWEAAFASGGGSGRYGLGIYGTPVFLWEVAPDGAVVRATAGSPVLPTRAWTPQPAQRGETIGTTPFLLDSVPARAGGWFVAGESLAELVHVRSVLVTSEALAFPILIVVIFLGSLAIGIRSVVPVEDARRRQLEFTADASHELRTPLSVIQAELALSRDLSGDATQRESTLHRIAAESARLQRIVEDLLWLARFDSEPAPPGNEPIDLATIAEGCADRFAGLAAARRVTVSVQRPQDRSVLVVAPPEWVDRLAGVLVDNACRYAGEGGEVLIIVAISGPRAVLAVEDSGPGIPPSERDRLFDRFHRASDEAGGHGLGLAIADSVVRSTGGRWRLGEAAAGGARMEVSWPLG